jgi:hypothetical protein
MDDDGWVWMEERKSFVREREIGLLFFVVQVKISNSHMGSVCCFGYVAIWLHI